MPHDHDYRELFEAACYFIYPTQSTDDLRYAFDNLLRSYRKTQDENLEDAVLKTLDRISTLRINRNIDSLVLFIQENTPEGSSLRNKIDPMVVALKEESKKRPKPEESKRLSERMDYQNFIRHLESFSSPVNG